MALRGVMRLSILRQLESAYFPACCHAAASSAGAGFTETLFGVYVSFVATHAKTGNLFFQFPAFAFRASGLLRALHHGFKTMLAIPADIFKNWHTSTRVKWNVRKKL